jgi:hypothetical protein
MSTDRIIHFDARKPTCEQVLMVVEDYFGECGQVKLFIGKNNRKFSDWFMIKLPGEPTEPLRRVVDSDTQRVLKMGRQFRPKDRWIEVIYTESRLFVCVNVLTRMQDEFTTAVAEGLAQLLARFWQGERQPD